MTRTYLEDKSLQHHIKISQIGSIGKAIRSCVIAHSKLYKNGKITPFQQETKVCPRMRSYISTESTHMFCFCVFQLISKSKSNIRICCYYFFEPNQNYKYFSFRMFLSYGIKCLFKIKQREMKTDLWILKTILW